MTMRYLMVVFLLFCYACVTSGKENVKFSSKNFYNTLTWDPASPRIPGETVRYSVSYCVTDDSVFHEVAECQNITELICDLTTQTPANHDTHYRARVFADGLLHGVTRKFKPIAETVFGTPTLSYNTSSSSLHMKVTLPVGPKNESFEDIFIRNHKGPTEEFMVYSLRITEPPWAAHVFENTSGYFDVSLKNNETKYCGYVVYTPRHEWGRPWSEKAFFCAMLEGKPWMALPWLLLSTAVVAAGVLMAVCFVKCYIKDVKKYKLPLSLVSDTHPAHAILYPQKEPNISKPEVSIQSEVIEYASIKVNPNVSSDTEGVYGHKNTIFGPLNGDSSSNLDGLHSSGLHDRDSSGQSSEIYGAVTVEDKMVFDQHHLQQTERTNTPLLCSGNGVVETRQLFSTLKTMPLSSLDDFDNIEAQPLILPTQMDSEGHLILPMPSFQAPQTFTEEIPAERKPLLSYLIVPSDKGGNFFSLHSLESSECSDSGLDENTLPTPTQDYGNSQYIPTRVDLTGFFSPSPVRPVSCDSGTQHSAYKQNGMPSFIHDTFEANYPFTWSGRKEEQ